VPIIPFPFDSESIVRVIFEKLSNSGARFGGSDDVFVEVTLVH